MLLSEAEVMVAELAADGREVPAIAETLGIAAATVVEDLDRVYRKLGSGRQPPAPW